MRYTLVELKQWTIESLYAKATLIYQKIHVEYMELKKNNEKFAI